MLSGSELATLRRLVQAHGSREIVIELSILCDVLSRSGDRYAPAREIDRVIAGELAELAERVKRDLISGHKRRIAEREESA